MLSNEQRTAGFAMQSFFIGTGAVIASALPYLLTNLFGISNTAPEMMIPDSVKYSFYIGAIVFFLAVFWTVFSSKEYSPEELAAFDEGNETGSDVQGPIIYEKKINYFRNSLIWILVGIILSYIVYYYTLDKELYVLGFGAVVFGIIQLFTGFFLKNNKTNGMTEIIEDLFHMPKTMSQLAVVQFFSWFALFAMWIYTVPAVTSHIYGTNDTTSVAYNEGANWVGVLMSVYNGFAALIAFLIPVIAKRTNRKITHLIALTFGGLGLLSFYIFKNPYLLIISEIGIGFAWASILSMPYAILTGSLPSNKMGVYMGIFNFFIVIPQILAASILGFVTKNLFGGEAIYALILGGISMIIAGLITLKVDDKNG
jgi:maltose/moltooligosaccharide transporter